jgi:hypothetical protein
MEYLIKDHCTLQVYMQVMIKDRLAAEVQDKHDLFSGFIHIKKGTIEGASVTEEEIDGFVCSRCPFTSQKLKELTGIRAESGGLDNSTLTLSFTFALLALYPEVQEKLLKHIRSVIRDGRRPVFSV